MFIADVKRLSRHIAHRIVVPRGEPELVQVGLLAVAGGHGGAVMQGERKIGRGQAEGGGKPGTRPPFVTTLPSATAVPA